ncbi:Cobalt-zinc-cadmium resistance protein CzcB (plasmid) [Variovorax sp. WDL1]|nr:efflux RND transporter periplasmic adaptor subunit [Variovorax sp. WDL1]VTV17848.1 Cobalt-zinc-cadmium resistance protein CzcB [Variovorax sp. WDL1]
MNCEVQSASAARPLLVRLGIPGLAICASISLLALTACGGAKDAAAEKPAAEEAAEKKDELKLSKDEADRAGITLEELKAQALTDTVTVTATIRANQDRIARIAPRVEGRVVSVSGNLGDSVRPGQALATLDSVAVGEASSALSQARSASRVAEADYKRAASLQAEEIISQKDFLRARAENEKASAALRAAQDHLRLLGVPGTSGIAASVFPLNIAARRNDHREEGGDRWSGRAGGQVCLSSPTSRSSGSRRTLQRRSSPKCGSARRPRSLSQRTQMKSSQVV